MRQTESNSEFEPTFTVPTLDGKVNTVSWSRIERTLNELSLPNSVFLFVRAVRAYLNSPGHVAELQPIIQEYLSARTREKKFRLKMSVGLSQTLQDYAKNLGEEEDDYYEIMKWASDEYLIFWLPPKPHTVVK